MKIAAQVVPLARDHHQALVLANRCIKTADSGDSVRIQLLCQQISSGFHGDMAQHFADEETYLFAPLIAADNGLKQQAEQLQAEHQQMFTMAAALAEQPDNLKAFGELLRAHARLEDRVVFPVLEQHLSEEQLKALLEATQ